MPNHLDTIEYPYTVDVLYEAAIKAVESVPRMVVKSVDPIAHRIEAAMKMSLMSWGDAIVITIASVSPSASRLRATSGAKMGSMLSGGQQVKNVSILTKALSEQLKSILPNTPPTGTLEDDITEQLRRLSYMLEEGLITQADYDEKKQELLSRM